MPACAPVASAGVAVRKKPVQRWKELCTGQGCTAGVARAMYTGNRKGGARRWSIGVSADYKVRFEEWWCRRGPSARLAGWGCTLEWAQTQCTGCCRLTPGLGLDPTSGASPALGDSMAEIPLRGLAGSCWLGQGRGARSVSRRREREQGRGIPIPAQHRVGAPGVPGDEGRGKGITSELQAPLNKSSL